MKANTKQHYVPQFYLRGWSDDRNCIWAYPVEKGKPFETSVGNVACERGLYTHPKTGGTDPLATGRIMAKIEGHYSTAWPAIWDRASAPRTRKNLSNFVAMMAVRHPETEDRIRYLNTSVRSAVRGNSPSAKVTAHQSGKSANFTVAEVLSGTSTDDYKLKSTFLRFLPGLAQEIAKVLVG